MKIAQAKPLFAWDCLEDSPSLKTIRELLAAIPDGRLLQSLRDARGKGRNDYPVHTLWGVVVLTVALRRLIGIEHEDNVPLKWNKSRFEETQSSRPPRRPLGFVLRMNSYVDCWCVTNDGTISSRASLNWLGCSLYLRGVETGSTSNLGKFLGSVRMPLSVARQTS